MEELIGVYSVTYTTAPPATELSFLHLIGGYVAARFAGSEVDEFKQLLETMQKRIYRFGDTYNVITGANGDLSIYAITTGRRTLYFNNDEVDKLKRLLERQERIR